LLCKPLKCKLHLSLSHDLCFFNVNSSLPIARCGDNGQSGAFPILLKIIENVKTGSSQPNYRMPNRKLEYIAESRFGDFSEKLSGHTGTEMAYFMLK